MHTEQTLTFVAPSDGDAHMVVDTDIVLTVIRDVRVSYTLIAVSYQNRTRMIW